jgi:hypothetical protein
VLAAGLAPRDVIGGVNGAVVVEVARQVGNGVGDEDPLRASVKLAQKANLL